MTDRSPGRYNLHRLGWAAFEDLCMQIMRVKLGETATRFRPGPDGGRDGWFRGVAEDFLGLSGAFVIQCKHTSAAQASFSASDLKSDLKKVPKIAGTAGCIYILMTNRQVTAQAESGIQQAFEACPGVEQCVVLGETWVEDTIDAHPRLLRLVPRLYGIGDLAQIVAFTLHEQTKAILEDLAVPLRTFVPTDSYRRAERALHERKFVFLSGPPASGKSAIAANLCLVTLAQEPNVRVLRIEEAAQFKASWSPTDPTIYWVDDVFGETTLDEERVRDWSTALDKVEVARNRTTRFIFASRDYILAAAREKLRASRSRILDDARVVVEVTSLSEREREEILYNHIKDGDISREQKGYLKRSLPHLASLSSFSPELARRLGNKLFHRSLDYDSASLCAFFEKPVEHFREMFQGLSPAELSALVACLHSGNALDHPVSEASVAGVLKETGVSLQSLAKALASLNGSLVKLVTQSTSQTWQLHHPSMVEALQTQLAGQPQQLLLYLQCTQLHTLLRDTTTTAPSNRLVFIPSAAYIAFAIRLRDSNENRTQIAGYLAAKSSPAFLRVVNTVDAGLIDWCLSVVPTPGETEYVAHLAVRLHEAGLFDAQRRVVSEAALKEGLHRFGWCGFVEVEGLRTALPSFVESCVRLDAAEGFASIERLHSWYTEDLSASEDVGVARQGIEAHCTRLQRVIRSDKTMGGARAVIVQAMAAVQQLLDERRAELEENETEREYDYDEWKEQRYEERLEMEQGRFADVDE